jgi:DNA primase large subunit
MPSENMRDNAMMAHLMDSLEAGKDIGHYGRLVFAMVARHFMSKEEVVGYLRKDQDFSDEQALALYDQVQGRDYNPPRRERILQWQNEQEFPICPDAENPDACNVYKDLKFPEEIYRNISEYHVEKEESGQAA